MKTINLPKENSITNNIIDENIYFEIIYKPKKDNQNKNKIFDYEYYLLEEKFFKDESKIKIFDNGFINKNKDKCKIIYQNKEYELKENFEDIDNHYQNKEEISFVLKINKNINDISRMFIECDKLLIIRDISNVIYFNNNRLISKDIKEEIDLLNVSKENDEIFNQNEQNNLYKYIEDDQILSSISNITNKNSSNNFLSNKTNDKDNLLKLSGSYNFLNVTNMSYIFSGCVSLI